MLAALALLCACDTVTTNTADGYTSVATRLETDVATRLGDGDAALFVNPPGSEELLAALPPGALGPVRVALRCQVRRDRAGAGCAVAEAEGDLARAVGRALAPRYAPSPAIVSAAPTDRPFAQVEVVICRRPTAADAAPDACPTAAPTPSAITVATADAAKPDTTVTTVATVDTVSITSADVRIALSAGQ